MGSRIAAQDRILEDLTGCALLDKDIMHIQGNSLSDPITFNVSCELTGLRKRDLDYLPHFEFNVGTTFFLTVPSGMVSGPIHQVQNGTEFNFVKDGIYTPVKIPRLDNGSGLFRFRNLFLDGNLTDFPEGDNPPIDDSHVGADFYLRASSTTHGQFTAVMPIDHPDAECVIGSFLRTIDERFADYASLEQHHQRTDNNGRILWEDQGMQSKVYNKERDRLHKALFRGLEKVMKDNDLDYRSR